MCKLQAAHKIDFPQGGIDAMKILDIAKKLVKCALSLTMSLSALTTVNAQEVNFEEALSQEPTGVELVLVTNNDGSGRNEYFEPLLKEAGFNVTVVGLGGADVTARVIAEVENPTTNVVWGPTMFNFDDMIEAGALVEWEPTWKYDVSEYDRGNGYSYPS